MIIWLSIEDVKEGIIFTSVMDIPFFGKIFFACLWRSYILIAYTWKEV